MNFHHLHNQALDWMSSTNPASATTTATKIEEVDEEEDGNNNKNKKESSSSTTTTAAGAGVGVVIEREHMFDKVVTPSDVGKLNRLVIPKQHAEKYFPLDSSNNEKGLLLNFEDRTGKPWRFRYSYWNSSQSYVMTKGWSRFVKEKKLDAGDIVSFQRGVGDKDRLFIDWRRRPDASAAGFLPHHHHHHHLHHPQSSLVHYNNQVQHGRAGSWATTGTPAFVLRSHPYAQSPYAAPPGGGAVWDPQAGSAGMVRRGGLMGMGGGGGHHYGYGVGNVVNPPPYPVTGSLVFVRSGGGGGGGGVGNVGGTTATTISTGREGVGAMMRVQGGEGGEESMVYESVPVVQGKAAAKRLRLFGVNMECPISHQTHDFDILSSSLASSSTSNNHPHPHPHYHQQQQQLHEQQQQQQQHIPVISMGPLSSSSTTTTSSPSPSQHHTTSHHNDHPLQLRSFFDTTSLPPPKGKSSPSSSPMSLDLDI